MYKIICILFILLSFMNYSSAEDVTLTVTIPEIHIDKVLIAFKNTYPKLINENDKQFGERVVRTLIKDVYLNYKRKINIKQAISNTIAPTDLIE